MNNFFYPEHSQYRRRSANSVTQTISGSLRKVPGADVSKQSSFDSTAVKQTSSAKLKMFFSFLLSASKQF